MRVVNYKLHQRVSDKNILVKQTDIFIVTVFYIYLRSRASWLQFTSNIQIFIRTGYLNRDTIIAWEIGL